MMASRGMGAIAPSKMPKPRIVTRKDNPNEVTEYSKGGKVSHVNEAGNYTKPGMRKSLFKRIKAGGKGGAPNATNGTGGIGSASSISGSSPRRIEAILSSGL